MTLAIVYQQNIHSTPIRRNSLIEPADEFRRGSPVVAEWHKNYDT